MREMEPGQVRSHAKAAPVGRWLVDVDIMIGTYTCKDCSTAQNLSAWRAMLAKREGRIASRARRVSHIKRWQSEHPEQYRATIEKAVAASVASRRGHTLNPTPLQRARWSLSGLTLDPKGRFSLCRLCDRLMFTAALDLARFPSAGQYHATCVNTWRRETSQGVTAVPPPPGKRGRGRSEAELRESYRRTVLLFRQHQTKTSAAQLADEIGVTREALYQSTRRFLSLLPDASVATGPVRTWRGIFLALSGGVYRTPAIDSANAPE